MAGPARLKKVVPAAAPVPATAVRVLVANFGLPNGRGKLVRKMESAGLSQMPYIVCVSVFDASAVENSLPVPKTTMCPAAGGVRLNMEGGWVMACATLPNTVVVALKNGLVPPPSTTNGTLGVL